MILRIKRFFFTNIKGGWFSFLKHKLILVSEFVVQEIYEQIWPVSVFVITRQQFLLENITFYSLQSKTLQKWSFKRNGLKYKNKNCF